MYNGIVCFGINTGILLSITTSCKDLVYRQLYQINKYKVNADSDAHYNVISGKKPSLMILTSQSKKRNIISRPYIEQLERYSLTDMKIPFSENFDFVKNLPK